MISLDRTPTAERDTLSAEELSTRIPLSTVTRVPHGPTGLWEALAAAATRRRRAESAHVADLHVVDVTCRGADPSTAVGILDTLGVDVVPLPG